MTAVSTFTRRGWPRPTTAWIVPAGLVGLWAANHLFRRISRDGLMRAVSLMLAASGASLIVRALG